MSTQQFGTRDLSSLSLRRKLWPRLRLAFFPMMGSLFALATACNRPEACEYRCTADRDACPDGLTCDITLGYCVSEDYTGTCDAETHEIVVCEGEPVELELPAAAPSSPKEIQGLPDSAKIEGGKLKAQFSKKTVIAFGAPHEARQYWQVAISDDCPVLETTLAPLCVGDNLSRALHVRGGSGDLAFELLEGDADFTLSKDGVLSGKATAAGEHELKVGVTDGRGLKTVRSVTVAVSSECPSLADEVPKSCAGAGYEVELGIVGRAPVRVTDFTPIKKDGKDVTSTQAKDLVATLGLDVVQRDERYLLTAAPRVEALGDYVLALKLENALSIEQLNVPFGVKTCSTVRADFTECEGQRLDFDLRGSPGDVWGFYDHQDPLRGPLAFVSDRRLRGDLTAPGFYEVRARVQNALEQTDRLVTLELAILEHSDPACLPGADAGVEDAGAPSTGDSASETSPESVPRVDAATPPVEDGVLGEGCVGRPYEFAVPMNGVTSETWHAEGLPSGLTVNAEGVISGTPTAQFDGTIDITGSTSSGSVGNSYRLTIHAWCSVVFKGVPDGSSQTHLYQADRRPNVALRDFSDDLADDEDVTDFAISPNQEYVAFSVFDSFANTTRVVVKRRVPLGGGQTETLVIGNITLSPFTEWVSDLSWGSDRHVSLIVGSAPALTDAGTGLGTAGVNQTVYVFDVVKAPPATTATQILAKTTRSARDLVWAPGLACVTLANYSGIAKSRETVCWNLSDGTSSSGAEIFTNFDAYQVRLHGGRFLQAHPFHTGTVVLTSWMPNAPSGELSHVIHLATFASPLGDLVATVRGSALEIARTGDDTSRNPSADYAPLGSVADCTRVDAWRGGGAFACSTGLTDPNEKVTIAHPTGNALSTLTPFQAPGHATSAQRIFLEDTFYVYDDLMGDLNYVDLSTVPPQVHSQSHGQGARAVALEPLDNGRFVMQGSSALWVGTVSPGALNLTQVNGTGTPAAFSECESAFGRVGFQTWCGGDEISRRFQVAPDDDLGALQTDSSNLELFSVSSIAHLKSIEDIRVSCGEHPYCLTEFQLAR